MRQSTSHEFAVEWEAIERDKNVITDEARTLAASIKAVLNSTGSLQKLLETWPEAKPFIPAGWLEQKSTAVVPVEMISKINAAAGLPVEAAA